MNRAGWRLGLEAALLALGLAGLALVIRALPLTAPERRVAWSATASDLQVAGVIWPARAGSNRLEMILTDGAGGPVPGAHVEAAFLPVGGGAVIARRSLAPTGGGPGQYASGDLPLTRPGLWQMLTTIQRAGQPDAYAVQDWRLDPDGALRPAHEPTPLSAGLMGWLNQRGALGLSGLALAAVAGWSWRMWRALPSAARGSAGWWLALGLLLAALIGYLVALFNA